MAGRYRILEKLGAGGMGAVFKAYDTQLNRYVAVKRLLSKEEADSHNSKSDDLIKEAGSLATLQHPNIVSVYDLANDDEGFFIVMELLEGETLGDWLQQGPMSLPDFYELATQTLEAILTAHHQSILHRDLKPENIKMLRLPGGRLQAKVLDFGLARLSYGARRMTEDQSGNIMGSIFYMAPEQFLRQPVDGRTDLYALGCLYYYVLSGRRPFDSESVQQIMDLHLQHRVYALNQIAPHVPSTVSDWVMWLMNRDPGHRPAHAQQALESLRDIYQKGRFGEEGHMPMAIAVVEPAQTRPATGSVSQRMAGNSSQRLSGPQPKRPTGAIPKTPTSGVTGRGIGGSTGALRNPPSTVSTQASAKAKGKPAAADGDKEPLPGWIKPAAVLVILALVYAVWPKGKKATPDKKAPATASSKSPTTSSTATPGALSLPSFPSNALSSGYIMHYRAGEKMDGFEGSIKQGEPVLRIHDLQSALGDAALTAFDNKREHAPKYYLEKVDGLKNPVGILRFNYGQGMTYRVDGKSGEARQYPLGAEVKNTKGITMMAVARPNFQKPESALFVAADDSFKTYLKVVATSGGDYILSIGTPQGNKEAKLTKRNTKLFAVVSVAWDVPAGKLTLNVRSADGGKAYTTIDVPKGNDFPVLTQVRIPDRNGSDPKNAFSGDLAQLIVWPFAMDNNDRGQQDFQLAQQYFNNPGSRY